MLSVSNVVPLESAVVRRITRLLDQRGAWYVKTTGVKKVGCPDLLVCYKGCFVALEVKRDKQGYGATPKQEHELLKIRQADGVAQVVWHEDQVIRILDWLDA